MGDKNEEDDLFFSIIQIIDGVEKGDAMDPYEESKTIGDLINEEKEAYKNPEDEDIPKAFLTKFIYCYEDEDGKEHTLKEKDLNKKMKLNDLLTAHGKIRIPAFYATFETAAARAEKRKNAERDAIKSHIFTRSKRRSRSTRRRSTRRRH